MSTTASPPRKARTRRCAGAVRTRPRCSVTAVRNRRAARDVPDASARPRGGASRSPAQRQLGLDADAGGVAAGPNGRPRSASSTPSAGTPRRGRRRRRGWRPAGERAGARGGRASMIAGDAVEVGDDALERRPARRRRRGRSVGTGAAPSEPSRPACRARSSATVGPGTAPRTRRSPTWRPSEPPPRRYAWPRTASRAPERRYVRRDRFKAGPIGEAARRDDDGGDDLSRGDRRWLT